MSYLKLGHTYHLKSEHSDSREISYYSMKVLKVNHYEYIIMLSTLDEQESRTFELNYDKTTVDRCVEQGSWTLTLTDSPNAFDKELFEI